MIIRSLAFRTWHKMRLRSRRRISYGDSLGKDGDSETCLPANLFHQEIASLKQLLINVCNRIQGRNLPELVTRRLFLASASFPAREDEGRYFDS